MVSSDAPRETRLSDQLAAVELCEQTDNTCKTDGQTGRQTDDTC